MLAVQHQSKKTSRETRLETRTILRQILSGKSVLRDLSHKTLHEQEVAAFVVKNTRCLWHAAQSAKLPALANILEVAFYEAFLRAGGTRASAAQAFEDITNPASGGDNS